MIIRDSWCMIIWLSHNFGHRTHVRNKLMDYMRKVLTRIFRTKLDKITELTCGTHRRVMRRVSTRILREAADNPHRKLVMGKVQIRRRSDPEVKHKRSSQRARTDPYVAKSGVNHALGSENENWICRTSARVPITWPLGRERAIQFLCGKPKTHFRPLCVENWGDSV